MKACNSAFMHPHHTVLWELLLPQELRLCSSFCPSLVIPHMHVSKILCSRGWMFFFMDLLCARIFCKICWAFWGLREDSNNSLLISQNIPTTIYFSKKQIKLLRVPQCLFTHLLFYRHSTLSRQHCFHFPHWNNWNYLPLLSFPSDRSTLPFPRKSLLLVFPSIFIPAAPLLGQ